MDGRRLQGIRNDVGLLCYFIKTDNSNGGTLPQWDVAKAGDPEPSVMIIDTESRSEKSKQEPRYEFLDKAYKNK